MRPPWGEPHGESVPAADGAPTPTENEPHRAGPLRAIFDTKVAAAAAAARPAAPLAGPADGDSRADPSAIGWGNVEAREEAPPIEVDGEMERGGRGGVMEHQAGTGGVSWSTARAVA